MSPRPGRNAVLELLLKNTTNDGGWGYHRDQGSHLEPTCLALLALAGEKDKYAEAIHRGLNSLEQHACRDGSYRLDRGREEAIWPTALVLFTRCSLRVPTQTCQPLIDKLLGTAGRVIPADPEVANMHDINLGLTGWPWAEGTFSWVEPTSWACLALRKSGLTQHHRVIQGMALLLDRAFDEGGANYGNRSVLGRMTEPIPGPSALMLLALQGVKTNPRIDAAIAYLENYARTSKDLEHLCWIKLALSSCSQSLETKRSFAFIDELILEAINTDLGDGLIQGDLTCRLALAALALNTDWQNPFKLEDEPSQAIQETITQTLPAIETSPARSSTFLERVRAKIQNAFLNGLSNLRPLPFDSSVFIGKVSSYEDDILAVLRQQYDHFRSSLGVQGKRVVLKPNLVEYHRDKVINTDPRFISAVIQLFKEEGASEIIVAEGPGHWRNVLYLVNESGLGDVLRRHDVRFVDINHDEPVKVPNVGRTTGLDYLYMSKTVLSADILVSLPKLKTHHWAGATLCLKNLFGTLPGLCYGWPKNELHWRGIPQSIVDIALTHPPHLGIIDGIIGMEGDGPLNGTARHAGVVIMGLDLLAVDATGCRVMGIDPLLLPTFLLAEQKRLGRLKASDITQIGSAIDEVRQQFRLPPNYRIENNLMMFQTSINPTEESQPSHEVQPTR